MRENDLPAEAIVDRRTITDPPQLHALLTRLPRTDRMSRLEIDSYRLFLLVTRHADITAMEGNDLRRRDQAVADTVSIQKVSPAGGPVG